jgi:hypothetical protein
MRKFGRKKEILMTTREDDEKTVELGRPRN